ANQQATATTGNFVGVDVNGASVRSTGAGIVTVKGRGGSDASGAQYGVYVHGATGLIKGGSTAGTTTTVVVGTGGPNSGGSGHGVFVSDTNSSITSAGGDVSVTGTGSSNGGAHNYGVIPFQS